MVSLREAIDSFAETNHYTHAHMGRDGLTPDTFRGEVESVIGNSAFAVRGPNRVTCLL